MKDGGEGNYISCARSDTESTSVIHWIDSLRKPGEGHLHLRFVKQGNEVYKFSALIALSSLMGSFCVVGFCWGFFIHV